MGNLQDTASVDAGKGLSLQADRLLPESPWGVALFVSGVGSGRRSPRHRRVADTLAKAGCGSVLLDLTGAGEQEKEVARLDVDRVAERIKAMISYIKSDPATSELPLGLFGSDLGAAYAFAAAVRCPKDVRAVVSSGGRVDLVDLDRVTAPTLLLVGSKDASLVGANRNAMDRLGGPKELSIIEGAGHRFEEAVAIAAVADAAASWFETHLKTRARDKGALVPAGEEGGIAPAGGQRSVIERRAEAFRTVDGAQLDGLLARIGDAKVVLIGEATHGTSEFYRMRNRITQALIEERGFSIVSAEADWPDAEHVDEYVRARARKPGREWETFARFPTWMWRNEETLDFLEWMKSYNATIERPERRVGFYGLDLYSLHTSMHEVIKYLEAKDEELAYLAKERYRTLLSFQQDPVDYGRAALRDRYTTSESDVVRMLSDLLARRLELIGRSEDERAFFDAERNAAVVASAEKYYRLLFHGSYSSWNHRDQHMFETLQALLDHRGPDAKAVVWAHNSHVGDAACTEMKRRGETNLGEMTRDAYGDRSYIIGFGTHHGMVAAASDWGGEVEIKKVRPSHPRSYERFFHDNGPEAFLLPLRGEQEIWQALSGPRLERAIGVIYRPETELLSHYFEADLPHQFDEYIWFDRSHAVTPLTESERAPQIPERHPFLLAD